MHYVSNAGVILSNGGASIGIDCFSKDADKIYQDIPASVRKELLEEIEKGNLNTLIFTHEHSDHFCVEDVKEAWNGNRHLQIYSTCEVIKQLLQAGIDVSCLHQVSEGQELHLGNINISFLYTAHEGEQYANVPNLTLLIKIEDKKVVVTGDAAPCETLFQKITTWSRDIDWFFAPFPYVGLRSTRKILYDNINIHNIFVLHQPRKEADTQHWVSNAKKVCECATDGLPMPIFPENPGDRYCI